jgi:hypothetical protein
VFVKPPSSEEEVLKPKAWAGTTESGQALVGSSAQTSPWAWEPWQE